MKKARNQPTYIWKSDRGKKKLQLLISEKTMEYVSVEITYLYVKNFILHTKSN